MVSCQRSGCDYINNFQEMIDLAEYDDDKTIVIKFCQGLDLTLQNQVALLRDGAPDLMIWKDGTELHDRLLGTGRQ
jgi:hypothetical protein